MINEEKDLDNIGIRISEGDMLFKSKADKSNHTKYVGISGKTGKGVSKLISEIEFLCRNEYLLEGIILYKKRKVKFYQR